MTSAPRASVVVPTYRRPELLDRCLRALAAQDLRPAQYEVIVADDAACEETRRLVERGITPPLSPPSQGGGLHEPSAPQGGSNQESPPYEGGDKGGVRIRYVPVRYAHGPAAARNAGWHAARGDVIAFTDDDTIPDPGWLRAGLAVLESADAAWGQVRVPLPQPPTDYERNEAGLETAEFATANAFCRRSALAAVGGFDERFTAAWREDADLFFTLLEKGFRVVRAPEAVVVHPVRPGRWAVCLGQQRKSQFNALLYKKHPGLYRQRIQPTPPWHYYAAVAALLAAAAGVAARLPVLALAGSGLWLALTARFCGRRLRGTSHAPARVAEMAVTSALVPLLSVYWRLRGALRFRVLFL